MAYQASGGVSERALRSLRRTAQVSSAGWSEEEEEALKLALGRRIRRHERNRRVLRAAGTLGAFLLMAGTGALLVARSGTPLATGKLVSSGTELALSDGSVVTALSAETQVEPLDDATTATNQVARVKLARGAARFKIAKRPNRRFQVAAGDVTVEVLGTVFRVDRVGSRASVVVEEGVVKVSFAGGERILRAGETGVFPPPADRPTVEPVPAEPVAEPAPTTTAELAASPDEVAAPAEARAPTSGWRSLARAGRYEAAFRAMKQTREPVRDEPGDLMLAADVARKSRHPAQAVDPLRRVYSRYAGDDRAPPAAFLLGRIYLENLGRPREAADAFARARALAPAGALAEDALAREIEARARAGEKARAAELAADYLRRFPDGGRRDVVRPYLAP